MLSAAKGEKLRNVEHEKLFSERVRFFKEFLSEDYGENEYSEKIKKMISNHEERLIVDLDSVRRYSWEYAEGLLENPSEYLPAFDKALESVLPGFMHHLEVPEKKQYRIGIDGFFGKYSLTPLKVFSRYIGRLLCVEGIVTRCSVVRPKIVQSVHYCEKTHAFHVRNYQDNTELGVEVSSSSVYPKTDEDGNPLTTEFGLSTYRDHQTATLQEIPEKAPVGHLPCPLEVVLDGDLVNKVKPGDRVKIVGVYKTLGGQMSAATARFRTILLACNVKQLSKEFNRPQISDIDIHEIKKISKLKNITELFVNSIAPSICGHECVKLAVLLQLLGGTEKILANGAHLRGDINILLIGDPSTAKSQILRYVLNIAPLAIATTGRGSSGVGLTAAVTQDRETGERTLEAGAMVCGDRGVVCIDEFDKMSDMDRVAIHEAMEQQTVTISKGGIHSTLNARCSVLAAANPAYGNYMIDKPPYANILLPDSLLSRFDLVFIILDQMDDESNRRVAEHVTRMHMYIPPNQDDMLVNNKCFYSKDTQKSNTDKIECEVYEKYNKMLHSGISDSLSKSKKGKSDILSMMFLKKYIHYAKTRVKPVLTKATSEIICSEYAEFRSLKEGDNDKFKTMPITARTLETLIRLATAFARLRLSPKVEKPDARAASDLLKFSLFREVRKSKRKKMRITLDSQNESDAEGHESESQEQSDDNHEEDSQMDISDQEDVSEDRISSFRSLIYKARLILEAEISQDAIPVKTLVDKINSNVSNRKFSLQESRVILKNLSSNNLIWYQEEHDSVFFV